MLKYNKFYEMDIWKEAFKLQEEVFDLTKNWPKEEQFALISQINRSTNSVCANIAEYHGRFSYADKIRVLYIVRGELQETQNHLFIAKSRGYLPENTCNMLVDKYENLKIKLNNAISYCARQRDGR